MKVLIIHTLYKLKGGEDSVVFNEMALLQQAGVETSLLQFTNTGGNLAKLVQLPFNLSAYSKTKKKILAFKPDVVHIHNLHFAGSASVIYAIKAFNIPIVATLHNYRLLCPSATLFFNGKMFTASLNQKFPVKAATEGVYLNSKALTLWVSVSMWIHQAIGTWNKIDQYIALGQHTKEIFSNSKLQKLAGKISIKPNFCFKSTNGSSHGDYFLYVGRLSEEKGVNILLEAFAENKLPLKIAGTGVMEQDVKAYAEKFPNIGYLGAVDKDAVSKLLESAAALIFPSQWYETFGMVIIEAFSAGVPVIASNLGQLKFTIKPGHNGLLFEPGSKDDLNNKILHYYNLPERDKDAFKHNALASYEENYSPDKNIAMLVGIYNGVLNKGIDKTLTSRWAMPAV